MWLMLCNYGVEHMETVCVLAKHKILSANNVLVGVHNQLGRASTMSSVLPILFHSLGKCTASNENGHKQRP